MSDSPGPDQPLSIESAELLDHGAPASQRDILPDSAASRSDRGRWPFVAGAVGALVVAGAGLAFGMAMSGGGTQPEELIPADAIFYADFDLDPGADQKVNLVRLLTQFPEIRDQLGDRSDIKLLLVDELLSDSGLNTEQVADWIGDRAGVAVLWGAADDGPTLAVVAQVTDEGAARTTLADALEDNEFTFASGYAVITSGSESIALPGGMDADEVVRAAGDASLADDADFRAAMDPLGSGVASVYVDGDRLARVITDRLAGFEGMGAGSYAEAIRGHTAMVVRVEPSAVEIVGRSSSATAGTLDDPTELFDTLPDGLAVAVAGGGGGDAVSEQWDQIRQQVEDLQGMGGLSPDRIDRMVARVEAQYNIRLPDDLITLFGDDTAFAVSADGLMGASPGIGLRSVTDPVAAQDLAGRLQPLLDELTAGYGFTVSPVEDGLVVASSDEFAQQLASGEGGILDDATVMRALPDTDGASVIGWLDLETLGSYAALADPQAGSVLKPLEGLGVVAGVRDGTTFFTARLTFDEE